MRYEKKEYAHVRIFDGLEDMLSACETANDSKHVNANSLFSQSFVGRYFSNWSEVYQAARSPWDEGRDIIERMLTELEHEDLPKPVSRKRKARFSDDSGDEVDYDRLRSGRAYWRECKRQSMTGPQNVTIVIDVSTQARVPHENILWRGAAAIAATKVLEEAGFRVDLWAMDVGDEVYKDGTGVVNAVCLKRAGDPLDIATLAATVSGWAFRSIWFKAMAIKAWPKSMALGHPRNPTMSEMQEITGEENPVLVANVYDEYAATWLAKSIIKRLAGIEDPPPPPPEMEVDPVVSDEPSPEPALAEPPKPKTKAEIRAERAAQRAAERQWKRYWKQRERENKTGQ